VQADKLKPAQSIIAVIHLHVFIAIYFLIFIIYVIFYLAHKANISAANLQFILPDIVVFRYKLAVLPKKLRFLP
jgi:hypothetical protein